MTELAQASDVRFTPDQLDVLARFEVAQPAPESYDPIIGDDEQEAPPGPGWFANTSPVALGGADVEPSANDRDASTACTCGHEGLTAEWHADTCGRAEVVEAKDVVDRVAVALWRSDTEAEFPGVDLERLWPKVVDNFPDDAAAYRRLAAAAVAAMSR